VISLTPRPVGWTARTGGSMFQYAPFSSGLGAPVAKQLGQADQQWFARAKASVASYDDLWARAQQISDQAYRDQLAAKYHTKPEDQAGALYRRNSVAFDVSQAESFSPVKYSIYTDSAAQDKVTKLEGWNDQFRGDVEHGEQAYGTQAKPGPVDQTATLKETKLPGWVLPVGIGLGILVIGALLFGGD